MKNIKRAYILLLVAVVTITASCVTPQQTYSGTGIDFRQYKTVRTIIVRSPSMEQGSTAAFATETIDLFGTLLDLRLKQIGYDHVAQEAPADFTIRVTMQSIKPGDAAARLIIGFGAGRAVMTFTADFENSAGDRIAAFSGGRSHTGMEFGESFASNEQLKVIMASASVDQIQQFIANNGTIPKKTGRPRQT